MVREKPLLEVVVVEEEVHPDLQELEGEEEEEGEPVLQTREVEVEEVVEREIPILEVGEEVEEHR